VVGEIPERPIPPAFAWAGDIETIGVTGTNGKTSTTLLIASILRAAGIPALSITTLGQAIDGEPLPAGKRWEDYVGAFRAARERGCRHAVVEVTSRVLADGFAKRWRFDHAVFTNLTHDHLDIHPSYEHYLASKAQLFVHLGPGRIAVLNAADAPAQLIGQIMPGDVRRVGYAAPHRGTPWCQADVTAARIAVDALGTAIGLEPSPFARALGESLRIPLVGEVFAENALAAAALGLALGIEPAAVRHGLQALPAIPGRFEVVCRAPLAVVDDAHTPDALARTCRTARALAGSGKLIVVFGAGGERDRAKRGPLGEVVGLAADHAIITNDNPRKEDPLAIAQALADGCRRGGGATVVIELDRSEAIGRALSLAAEDDVVLVAGRGPEREQHTASGSRAFVDADVIRQWRRQSLI
jgi:UDP-N-acetylmuramoyl-L-alanyl-D-glutamate--2,6-diaminopimelate ligase